MDKVRLEKKKKKFNFLLSSIDRYGIMRPTKNVKLTTESEPIDMEKWKTIEKWLHWDLNPWKIKSKSPPTFNTKFFHFLSENNDNYQEKCKVQGLIGFLDSIEEDGGFLCVPGFQKVIQEWADENISKKFPETSNYVPVPKTDSIQNYTQKIPIKAGSLIIWDSRLPHCNFPNNSDKFRLNQYLKMFQSYKEAPKEYVQDRTKIIQQNLPKNLTLTELQKKILGVEKY